MLGRGDLETRLVLPHGNYRKSGRSLVPMAQSTQMAASGIFEHIPTITNCIGPDLRGHQAINLQWEDCISPSISHDASQVVHCTNTTPPLPPLRVALNLKSVPDYPQSSESSQAKDITLLTTLLGTPCAWWWAFSQSKSTRNIILLQETIIFRE